jgi:NADH:ubiquinone reductase (non-electrogenic)
MASGTVMRPLASFYASMGLQQVARRGLSSAVAKSNFAAHIQRSSVKRVQVQIPRHTLQQSFRRAYADEAAAAAKPPKRRFRFLRWTWRFIYISALAGLAYTGYGVWLGKNPPIQDKPDPKKKTLVVLGMQPLILTTAVLYWTNAL